MANEVVRTVCHGCRQVTQYRAEDGSVRPMILPGSGVVFADKAPGLMLELPCPVCGSADEYDGPDGTGDSDDDLDVGDSEGPDDSDDSGDSDDPGWVPGLIPPA